MNDQQRFLLVPEVAAILRLSEYKVREMTRSGELPAVRIGRAVRVDRVALDRWLAERQNGEQQQPTIHTFRRS